MNNALRSTVIFYGLLGLLALALPWIGVYPVFLMKLLCFAMFACAYNLLLGYGRMLSFGHAAFFGFAAYVTSWIITAHGAGPALAVLTGIVVAALLGAVIGGLAIRRHGIYFAMITLALGQLVYFVCLEAPFTGGENGLQGVPRGSLLGPRARCHEDDIGARHADRDMTEQPDRSLHADDPAHDGELAPPRPFIGF